MNHDNETHVATFSALEPRRLRPVMQSTPSDENHACYVANAWTRALISRGWTPFSVPESQPGSPDRGILELGLPDGRRGVIRIRELG